MTVSELKDVTWQHCLTTGGQWRKVAVVEEVEYLGIPCIRVYANVDDVNVHEMYIAKAQLVSLEEI